MEVKQVDPWREGKKQISAEESRVQKQEGKAENYHRQPELSPDWLLLGLQHLRAQCSWPLQKERNLLIDIAEAPELDNVYLDRS